MSLPATALVSARTMSRVIELGIMTRVSRAVKSFAGKASVSLRRDHPRQRITTIAPGSWAGFDEISK